MRSRLQQLRPCAIGGTGGRRVDEVLELDQPIQVDASELSAPQPVVDRSAGDSYCRGDVSPTQTGHPPETLQ